MLRLTRTQVQPIGLDIGRDAIKMLQLEVVGGEGSADRNVRATAGAIKEFPPDAKLAAHTRMAMLPQMLRQLLRQNPFKGRNVAVALPREFLHLKNLRLPQMPPEELESAVRFEARNIFPFDTEDAQVHCLAAGEVRQGNDLLQEVIVLAARNQDVNGFVQQLHACGLIIQSMDVEGAALFRGVERFARRREDEQEVHMLADVGLGSTQVVIGRGRDISFLKTIEIGGVQFQEAISKKLGISIEEAQALRRRLAPPAPPAPATADPSYGPPYSASASDGHPATTPPPTPQWGAAQRGADDAVRDPVRQAVFDATRSVMEQLGRELSLCLRYQSVTFRGQRPARLRLLGGEGADSRLREILNSILTIPIEASRPLYLVDCRGEPRVRPGRSGSPAAFFSRLGSPPGSPLQQTAMGEWGLALGLALRQTTGRFRPCPQSHPPRPISEKTELRTQNSSATADLREDRSQQSPYRAHAVAANHGQDARATEAPHA